MSITKLYRTIALAAILFACNEEPSVSTTAAALEGQGKLSIEISSEREFVGSYEGPGGGLKFVAVVESETRLSAVVYANDTPIEIYATGDDMGYGEVGFRVHGGILDENAHLLLAGLHGELAHHFPYPEEGAEYDSTPAHVQLLRTYVGFLSEAPLLIGDKLFNIVIEPLIREIIPVTKQSSSGPIAPPAPSCNVVEVPDNDGVSPLPQCCFGGTTIAFQHDDTFGGSQHCFVTSATACGLNSPTGCVGRCGPGCFSNPGYYQDCADHDACLDHDGGTAVVPTDECSDEWHDAVDDTAIAYSFVAPIFWGANTGLPLCF